MIAKRVHEARRGRGREDTATRQPDPERIVHVHHEQVRGDDDAPVVDTPPRDTAGSGPGLFDRMRKRLLDADQASDVN